MKIRAMFPPALLFMFSILLICNPDRAAASEKTEVLVVGTIHGRHARNPNYSYSDIARILSTYNPDLICVEIRAKDFRRKPYLKEMVLATVWGLLHEKKVAPIDWWDDVNNARELRAKLAVQPEYIKKEEYLKSLVSKDELMTHFQKQYGTFEQQSGMGYRFWNGKDYNDYIAESYRLSMEVYGDSPINLYYQSRNQHMMDLIWDAIRQSKYGRVLVFTGSEHKHFFDRELKNQPEVNLVEFGNLLPLKEQPHEKGISDFLEEENDLLYYEKGYPEDMEAYYRNKLVDLLHGPDMDLRPETIPQENILIAGKVLERWQKLLPESDMLHMNQGWHRYLKADYAGAIQLFQPLAQRIESGAFADPWARFQTYLNLGWCYDLVGEREKAVACYIRGEELIRGTSWEPIKKFIFQDYKNTPYRRP